MMDSAARYLVFHGAIVFLVGLFCGAPYGRAINRDAPVHIVHAWRVAHAGLPLGAALMFAVAAVLPSLTVETAVKWVVSIALITSSYAFCAMTGHRGLAAKLSLVTKLVWRGQLVGANCDVSL